jgi:F0F1-type ATP synthase membrane subunit c/vacuolar-type H+-ATPase subunit K
MATQTQEQIVRLAPFQEQFLADIFKSAEGLTGPGTQMPFSAQQLAGLSEGQQKAISSALSGVGAFQPFLQQGRDAVTQGIAGAQGADFTPTSYQQFMDPFTEDVIRATEADIARQGAMQQNQLGAGAVGAGAFGGSRQGIAQGEIARNVQDQMARTTSQLRSQGFTQAQNLAQQAAQQQLRQAQLGGQLGVSQAGLGQLGQQMGVQDINTLLGIGGLQQQQAQRQFDVTRANELAQQALPFQRIGFMSDIFRGVPALQQTYSTTTTPPPSRTSQLLGLGIAGLGAAGSAGGIGNLFNMGVRPT